MSRPYHFTPDQARSPLDRQPPNPFPAGQPPSFKTNVNRAKTKRWVEAKSYSYDGDDWGDADEYDEYGGYDGPLAQQPTGLRQPGQGAGTVNEAERSYADPTSSASAGHHRTTSYDRGDEYRDFSSGSHMPPPGPSQINNMDGSSNASFSPTMTSPSGISPVVGAPHNQQYYAPGPPLHVQTNAPTYHQPQGGYGDLSSGTRQSSTTSWGQSPLAESTSTLDPQQRRDFTPSAMPQPLHTRSPWSVERWLLCRRVVSTSEEQHNRRPLPQESAGQAIQRSNCRSSVLPTSTSASRRNGKGAPVNGLIKTEYGFFDAPDRRGWGFCDFTEAEN
ncbi:hypothetical protein H2199_005335 [Coniosporium tulheliwenetii]|uniref:Uncharacterized protein n=1 Tax=Coniosporium tulheliwenetii TaxID=3383036 RepID=A0ACC2Z1T9_9PEZI|nr:hypothetical protein H2199_005335 [Cladosporium sp. JES 115]